ENAAPVQVEVAAVDPELAEAEPLLPCRVHDLPLRVEQREAQREHVPGRVDVPELFRLPFLGGPEAAALQAGRGHGLAMECDHLAAVLHDPGAERIRVTRVELL